LAAEASAGNSSTCQLAATEVSVPGL
jgi:hypothetical protein